MSILWIGGVITVWLAGDFHRLHYSDTVVYSLIGLYRWTIFPWEYDHASPLLPLMVSAVDRPYWNLLALGTLTSLVFLFGLALWASLLSFRRISLTEGSIWVSLMIALVMPRDQIFRYSAHGITTGVAFLFAGLFVVCLRRYLGESRRLHSLALVAALLLTSILAAYVAQTILIPLGIVTAGLIWKQGHSHPPRGRWHIRGVPLAHLAPVACLMLAWLAYELLLLTTPRVSDLTLNPAYIPISFLPLLRNWANTELTTPWLLLLLPFALYRPRRAYRTNPLLAFLAAGVVIEMLVASSSRWVIFNSFAGHYLADLTFLVILAMATLTTSLAPRLVSPANYRVLLGLVAATTLSIHGYVWNAVPPGSPISDLERTIGANAGALVEARCDLVIGDLWKVWPAMLAVNDYYYREGIVDRRTGETRMIFAVAYRARAVEAMWRPRLNWPDVTLCGFANDEAEFQRSLDTYIPELAWQLIPERRVGEVLIHQVRPLRLQSLRLEFDRHLPGSGWSGNEISPDGDTFQWMNDTDATLILPLATCSDLRVEFRILYAMAPDILRSLTLAVNDFPIPLTTDVDGRGAAVFSGLIPEAALRARSDAARLAFASSRVAYPIDKIPGSIDPRPLALAFDWLQISDGRQAGSK